MYVIIYVLSLRAIHAVIYFNVVLSVRFVIVVNGITGITVIIVFRCFNAFNRITCRACINCRIGVTLILSIQHMHGDHLMIITIGTRKGGSGKSTTCSNLVVARQLAGKDVLLVDADDQRSIALWAALRDEKEVKPYVAVAEKTGQGFEKAVESLASRYQDTFIDVPGRNAPEIRASMMISDVFVIPLRPSTFDAWAFTQDMEMLSAARKFNQNMRVIVFFNGLSASPAVRESEIADMREVVDTFDELEVADGYMCHRSLFNKAIASGKSVLEMPGKSPSDIKARDEVNALYKSIFGDQ